MIVAGRDEAGENSNPLQGLTFESPTWIYVLKAEQKMDASKIMNE